MRSTRARVWGEEHKMTKETLLSVEDLSVAFSQGGRKNLAVDRITFDIKKGETVALVGESGSGKSVTAQSILRLLPYPAASHPSGRILMNGQDLLAMEEAELRKVRGNGISMIFQEPMASFAPAITIGSQMVEQLMIHTSLSRSAAQELSIELLQRVGI